MGGVIDGMVQVAGFYPARMATRLIWRQSLKGLLLALVMISVFLLNSSAWVSIVLAIYG
jgi:hypothetical protein